MPSEAWLVSDHKLLSVAEIKSDGVLTTTAETINCLQGQHANHLKIYTKTVNHWPQPNARLRTSMQHIIIINNVFHNVSLADRITSAHRFDQKDKSEPCSNT